MQKIIIAVLFLFQISACYSQSKSSFNLNNTEPKIDALIKQYQDIDIFSGVVLLAKDGKPIYHKAFGLADREKQLPNTLNTKFDIGSMNKTFTKTVVLQLLEAGKLKLSDKLGAYLAGFPKVAAENITIDHLLQHSSGYGDYFTMDYFESPPSEKNIAGLVKRIRKMPLLFEPGTEQEYSNSGYILLGAIIEKITGETYHKNVKERIVIPLGLKETYVEDKRSVPNRSIGYSKTITGELIDNKGHLEMPNPDGGFQCTASDIFKFYQEFHYGEKLLKRSTKMIDPLYQWMQNQKKTGGAIPHAGGFEGANTVNYEIMRDGITLIVFANMDEPVAEQLGAGILNILKGKTPNQPAIPAVQNVYQSYRQNGIDYVQKNFTKLIQNFHPTDPKDLILNMVGYELLEMNKVADAIAIFQLNTKMFPGVGNVWDSLGEAYLANGDKAEALTAYKKALVLDPEIPSAQKMVKKLE